MMKLKSLILGVSAIAVSHFTQAQIVVDNTTQTPEQLVQSVLVGSGVTVTNVQFNASVPLAQSIQSQVGYFDASGTTFPITEGLILATGNAQGSIGPNSSGSYSDNTGVAPDPNDADMAMIGSPYVQNNEAILEFDFIPTGDSVVFNYVFGSDEYHEFSTSTFNDGFGFIISGPGFTGPFQNGGENIAIIPGTSLPVTMNNLNNGGSNTGPCTNCAYLIDNPPGSPDIQYDGYTVVMQAAASVVCGQTYHIKMCIADAGDIYYDSGVFLEANSFSSNAPDINIQLVDVNGDPLNGNYLIEGCSSAAINIIKPAGYTDSTYTVAISTSGTATNGTDYTAINPNYTIPPGQDTLTVVIDALQDGLTEPTENLFIETYYLTPCGDTMTVSASLDIVDNPPSFNVFANDTTIDCPTNSIDITAWTDGGIPNLVYDWGIYGTGATASLPGNVTGTYTITVTDECGMVQDTTVTITVNPATVPDITFNQNTFNICPGDDAFIDATVNNPYDPGQLTYSWTPGGQTTEDITVSPTVLTWYYLTITDGCYNVTDSVKVEMGSVDLTAINITNATDCPGQSGVPGSIQVMPDDPAWTYTLIGGGNTFGPQNDGTFGTLDGGITYFLNVVSDDGCTVDTAVTVGLGTNAVTANFVLDSLRDVTCFGDNDGGAYVMNINGGVLPPFDVTWTHTSGLFDSEQVLVNGTSEQDQLFGGQWVVTVTDQEGCAWSQLFTIQSPDELVLDLIFNDPTCYQFSDGSVTISSSGGNGGNTFVITDDLGTQINGASTTANNLPEGWYYANITDSEGCFAEDSILLEDPGEMQIDLVLEQPLCYGAPTGVATVDTVYNYTGAYGQVAYFWNPNPSAIPNGIGTNFINHMGPGAYSLTINDENGCSKVFDFTIVYPPELVFTELGTDPAYCRLFDYQSGNGVVYAAAGGGTPSYNYTWTNLQTMQTSNNTTWGGLNPGDYFIQVVDGAGCFLTDTIALDSLNPIAEYTATSDAFDDPLVYEGTAQVCVHFENQSQYFANPNNPNSDTTFFWNFNYDNISWTISHDISEEFDTCYNSAGEYEVCLVALNKNGCSDTTCHTIIVHDPLQFLPINVFTPNGDGDNDFFFFPSQAVQSFSCTIVNRWGVTVGELTDITQTWNGTDMNGSACPDGVYFYVYEGISTDGTELKGQGTVTIIGQ
ncbi:choice-of-anchor L domain-containing protein [Paracrocinitomix mangrovi]|uniref:choice-of-anchor L domain-containing protein n=1 Tax=Paracrocinitomix mangrovi TaxID=2862509 RepID=UPI001C8ECFB1|nr:choice-of-anchor L domain-containing protein [Paracrocinitomix mangrovi]UKN03524.1 choice-of-anchor L domain-containing protein [Paracrocinitomix mangrovi]